MTAGRGDSGWAVAARNLYLVAMAVFVVTILIGVPNGLDLVEFDRNQLLTHVHSGTIGWLTLSIIATSFIAFRAVDARLSLALAITVPIYVAAFYTGSFPARAVTGVLLLVAILWLVAWIWRTYLAGERTVPRLGFALGLSTFAYGAIVGVLLQVGFASGQSLVPGDGIGAHAGAMTFGYLVLAGMAIVEWRVLGDRTATLAGIVQVGALFIGGAVISVALLASAGQVGGMIYLLAELVAVVLFIVRIVPRALRIDWIGGGAERYIAATSVWILVALGIFMYLVAQFVQNPDIAAIDPGVLVASDHAVYIGVITNATFAILSTLLAARLGGSLIRQVVFWGMNLGLAAFVVGLISGTVILKQAGAPTMGVCLLIGLGWFGAALVAGRTDPAPEALAADA